MNFVIFVISLAILIWGADILIKESEKIALRFGIPEFIIGATLVAIGTSLPEMAASMAASYTHKADMAVSNVIGSNILNITLVLASVFMISPRLKPDRDFFAKDSTWALMPVFVFILMIFDGVVSRFDALLLLAMMGAYLLFLLQDATGLPEEELEDIDLGEFRWIKTIPMLAAGLALVVFGAEFTVESAASIAAMFGVSEWIIGIVMLSLGTSLPELVVSISAALRGKVDMAVGNIIGSNMANTSVVLGASALINPLPVHTQANLFDIAAMAIATIILVFLTANKLYTRSAGISLLILFGLFIDNTLRHL